MSVADSQDVSIEVLGGLVTDVSPADLPHGVSPDCQDLSFQIGSVKTRPGVTALYTLAGNPTVNYMKTYENLQEVPRFLSLDSLGILRKDVTPGGALTSIYSGILPGSFCKSCTLFGREYFGFGNGLNGSDLPRQYDDTNFDRISQVGPGLAPTAADDTTSVTIDAPAGSVRQSNAFNINSISEVGNTVTVSFGNSFPANELPLAGDAIKIAAVSAGYNGTFTVAKVVSANTVQYINPTSGLSTIFATGTIQFGYALVLFNASPVSPTNEFQYRDNVIVAGVGVAGYNGTWSVRAGSADFLGQGVSVNIGAAVFALANSGGGTITSTGTIAAGLHQVSVIFVTRSTYYTKPAPPSSWTAAGTKRVIVSNIPIGPPNVVARVLCFSAVNGASFYHLGPLGLTIPSNNMYIADNTTTQVAVDFTDAQLLLGTLDDPLFNQIELPPVAGTIDYSNRLFGWGEQGNLQAFLNLTFDGGFSNLTSATTGTSPNSPLGWTVDVTSGAGGGSANVQGKAVVFGDAYVITGDGATAKRGLITQSAAFDFLLNPILQQNTAYTVRARIFQSGAVAGTIHVNLQSTSGAFTTVGISKAAGTLTGSYALYSGNLTSGLATIPADLLLQVFVDGTPTNNGIFVIDNIEIFPTNQQFNNSNVRASFGQLNTQGQESFDSQTGLIQPSLNDGQSVRTCFKIRERLYIVKEHAFYVTQDDGVNEPALWSVQDVSKKVGTPSVNGVGVGEDWAVIAHRTGLYLFWGGEPVKISQEIQPTWDTIDWAFGYTIAVTVDTRKGRILICAPFGESNKPNRTLVLDYHDVGSTPDAIASNPPIHLTYTGRKTSFDKARKWCPWTIPANSVAQIEQASGTASGETEVYFGSNDNTGNINPLDDTGNIFTDNGATIPSYYTTAFFVEQAQEVALQLKSHRKLFAYLTMYAQGVGTLGITVYLDSLLNAVALNPFALSNPAVFDLEMMTNQLRERMAVKVASSGNAQWFDFQKCVVNVKQDPWSPIRGF